MTDNKEVAVPERSAPVTLAGKAEYARLLAASGLLPQQYKGKPENVLWAVEYGSMLGLSPMAAMTGVHVIEGKPTASAGLISALVRRAGHRLRVSGNDTEAVAQIVRSDDPDYVFEARWTLDRAKQAGLTNKSVWKQYPAAMLKARAITEVARDACEEALFGLHYTPEELGANVTDEGVPADTVTVQPVRPPVPAMNYEAMARDATDMDGLREVWRLAKLNGDLTAELQGTLLSVAEGLQQPAAQEQVVDAVVVEDPPTSSGYDDTAWVDGEAGAA